MNASTVETIYLIAIDTVIFSAIGRGIGLFFAIIRMLRLQRQALTTKWGWIEVCTFGEILMYYSVTYIFFTKRNIIPSDFSPTSLVAPIIGAILALGGSIILLWTIFHFRKMATGHYIEKDHRIITTGPYRFIRHPVYLGAFLIWFSFAITFLSLAMFLITVLYVIPIYILYMRSEEAMMLDELGNEYKNYHERVGMIIPRFR